MKAKSGFRLRALGDEFILVGESVEQVNFNKMITMNQTAAYLWREVEKLPEFNAEKMAELLTGEYEVSYEQALSDAKNTIETWLNAGIIE